MTILHPLWMPLPLLRHLLGITRVLLCVSYVVASAMSVASALVCGTFFRRAQLPFLRVNLHLAIHFQPLNVTLDMLT